MAEAVDARATAARIRKALISTVRCTSRTSVLGELIVEPLTIGSTAPTTATTAATPDCEKKKKKMPFVWDAGLFVAALVRKRAVKPTFFNLHIFQQKRYSFF